MKAINIKWDTDSDKKLFNSLPQEVFIPDYIDIEDEDEVSDYISDEVGFCHMGYDLTE